MGILTTLAQYGSNESYYYTASNTDSEASAAVVLGLIFFTIIFTLAMYAISAYLLSRIFKKAGVEQWAAWVPFYNNWKLLEIGGQQGFWAVLALIPVINIVAAVFMYIAMYNVGLKLGQEGVFVLLAIFLPIVWIIWLAVDKSTWDDSKGAPSLARTVAPTAHHTTPTPPTVPPKPTA